MIHDQPRAAGSGQVQPGPLSSDTDSQAALGKKTQVHGSPGEPGYESARRELARLQDGKTLADHGHVALVGVAKRWRVRFADDAAVDEPTYRPCCRATCATPGNGLPSWSSDAVSPITKTVE